MVNKTGLAIFALSAVGGQALRQRRQQQQQQRSPQLPVLPKGAALSSGDAGSSWWVQDEELTYRPPTDARLSQSISDYYYALGSSSALSEAHLRHRVGGRGRVHIFHLPNGTGVLDEVAPAVAEARYREASLSELVALTKGERLGRFPEFRVPAEYKDPLGSIELAAEKQIMDSFTEAAYTGFLEELTKDSSTRLKVSSRNTDNKEATKQTVGYLQEVFQATGATTCVQYFESGSWLWKKEIYNVIGFVRGTEPGSVTIGAHFDDLPGSGSAPGAEDDGSGSAGVLTALQSFMASGVRPKKSIYFVAFGGEEQGLIGSNRFAQELKDPGSSSSPIPRECRVETTTDHTAFTMDMIGYRNPSFPADTVLIETKNWAKELCNPLALANQVNNDGRLTVTFSGRPFGSDHMSFLNKNLPATLLIDNDGDTGKYSCYHRSCDSMENINTRFATDIARMNLGAALRIAGLN